MVDKKILLFLLVFTWLAHSILLPKAVLYETFFFLFNISFHSTSSLVRFSWSRLVHLARME